MRLRGRRVHRSRRDTLRALPIGLVAGGLANAALVVAEFAGRGIPAAGYLTGRQYLGLTEYYLQASYFMALCVVTSLWFAFRAAGHLERALAVLAGSIGLAGLLISSSRGGLVLASAGCAFLYIQNRATSRSERRTSTRSVVLLLIPIVSVVLYLRLYESLFQRFEDSTVLGSLDQSDERRLSIQAVALDTVRNSPLGIGWDTFSTVSRETLGQAIRSPHNLYIDLALELGFVGAVALLLWLIWPAVAGRAVRAYITFGRCNPLLSFTHWDGITRRQ